MDRFHVGADAVAVGADRADHLFARAAFPEQLRSSPEFRIHISFFVSGTLSLYIMWLQGDLDCSTDDITKHLSRVIQATAPMYLNSN